MSTTNRAVFLSYAREDLESARRIAEALRAFGLEVWLDQNELRGGDAWDARIREQIRTCTLFVPVISAHTQARREGYFRREWKLAADRTHDMAGDSPFIVPVIVDETPEGAALMPDEFKRVHVARLPRGVPTTQFVEDVKRALAEPAVAEAGPANASGSATRAAGASALVKRRGRSHVVPWVVGAAVVIAAVAGVWRWTAARGGAAHATPVVLLMDSPYVDRVYDAATLKSGGTNADDITDALHDLPVTIVKENTSATWHRELEVTKMQPDLIVLHRSCFYTFPEARADELYPITDNKLVAFLGYVATLDPQVKFIVYSRHAFEKDEDAARWRDEAASRFPVLAARIQTWRVPLDRATFRHPLTAQELRSSVERALGLRMTAGR